MLLLFLVPYGLISMLGTPGVFVRLTALLALRRHAMRTTPDPTRAGGSITIRSSPRPKVGETTLILN